MLKKTYLLTFFFFIAFVNNSFAHTGLEATSPQNEEVVKEELQEISLTFETKVEQGSTFELNDSNGDSIPVDNISLNENIMVGNLSSPMENGSYLVTWKIIGADGHPIEGEFSFSVELPNSESPTVENNEVKEETPVQTQENETEKAVELETEPEQDKFINTLLPSIIGVLIVIVIGSFIWLMRRKK